MNNNDTHKLTRRQFTGTLAAVLTAPALLVAAAEPAKKKKKAEAKKPPIPPTPEPEDWLAQAAKGVREFAVPEGAEPAFTFRAKWRGHS